MGDKGSPAYLEMTSLFGNYVARRDSRTNELLDDKANVSSVSTCAGEKFHNRILRKDCKVGDIEATVKGIPATTVSLFAWQEQAPLPQDTSGAQMLERVGTGGLGDMLKVPFPIDSGASGTIVTVLSPQPDTDIFHVVKGALTKA